MAWVQDKKFFGIKKGISNDGPRPCTQAGSPFDRTVYPSPVLDPPGKHKLVQTAPNPSAFSFGVSVRGDVNPHDFLHRHTGFGGSVTMRAASAVPKTDRIARIGRPPASGCTAPRNNPPNSSLRRAFERGDLPCVISQASGKRALEWRVEGGRAEAVDYKFYLPIFFDGLREEENPLPWLASTGLADLIKAAPHKIAPLVPLLVIPLRNAINTRRRDVMLRAVEALHLLARCDVGVEGGPRAARALVPYFRQLLPVINIYCTRFRNPASVDGEVRGRKNLEEAIQRLLNDLERYGGPDALINIKYMVPSYTTCM
jgi:hypothetical protein